MSDSETPVGAAGAGVAGRCPRCGEGRLFDGFLTLASGCRVCGLDYCVLDAGDGPAAFVILIVGFVVVETALIVEVAYSPPLWLHLLLWIPLALALCLPLLRVLKGPDGGAAVQAQRRRRSAR